MKKILFVLFALCFATAVDAQDVIVTKNNEAIVCRVIEVKASIVVYQKSASNSKGTVSTIKKSNVSRIIYANGKTEVFSVQAEKQYAPDNQNTGTRMYNDVDLLNLDSQLRDVNKRKSRLFNKLGYASILTGGIVGGVVMLNAGGGSYDSDMIAGGIIIGVGVIGGVTCFCVSHHYNKQSIGYVQASPIFYQNFDLNNGKSMTAGIDLINDQFNHQKSLGLGVRLHL